MKLQFIAIAAMVGFAACGGGGSSQAWSPNEETAFVSQCMSEKETPPPSEALCRCELAKLEDKYPNKAAWEGQSSFAESFQVFAECN